MKTWSEVIDNSIENNTRVETQLDVYKFHLRHLKSNSQYIHELVCKADLTWELFELGKLSKEEANNILNNIKLLINDAWEDFSWRLTDERYKDKTKDSKEMK